jgi:UDP-glucose 4-epimerase
MRILVTGGAGFIGSHLTDRFLADGHQVLVIDNFTTGLRENLTSHPFLTIVEGTVADDAVVDGAFRRFAPEVVIHAAASYRDPENWAEDVRTNVLGTAHVVKAAKDADVKRFIYFQTALCYGLNPQHQPITLSDPIRSTGSSHAISKTAGEQYAELADLDWISFRLADVYGPRDFSGPLPMFYQQLTSNRSCLVTAARRDFVYIDDLLVLVFKAVEGVGNNGPYHVATGSDYSIKDLFEATARALKITFDKEVEVRQPEADEATTILLDPSKTQRDFRWRPVTPLSQGIAKTIAYYKQFGVSPTFETEPAELSKPQSTGSATSRGPARKLEMFAGHNSAR